MGERGRRNPSFQLHLLTWWYLGRGSYCNLSFSIRSWGKVNKKKGTGLPGNLGASSGYVCVLSEASLDSSMPP